MTMKRLPAVLLILLMPATGFAAGGSEQTLHQVGTLKCKILPHSGINLLIHSTREIDCTFTPVATDKPSEHYKGETGIGLGFDVAFSRSSTLLYSVLAKDFRPGTKQLAGKYSGAGGGATFGLSVGQAAPIRKDDGSISLQPVGGKNKGVGVAAGFTYLYLQASGH